MLRACVFASAAVAFARAQAQYSVDFMAPSTGPGKTQGGKATYQDAMPLGNGALTALAWANATAGGAGLMLGHQMAMSSHTELFKLALVQIAVTPNPFSSGAYFNQSLRLDSATVLIYMGGTGPADASALISVYADANSDALLVDISSPAGGAFSVTATVTSLRPSTPFNYRPAFGWCSDVQSQPDVFVDPLPAAAPLRAPRPQTPEEAIRHASGAARPTRTLAAAGRLPAVGAFQPGTVIVYHRNEDSDGLTVNETLVQQGLGNLVASTPDWWRDNQFGFALDGGSGPALTRVSPSVLSSGAAKAGAVQLRFTVLVVQTDSAATWLADLSAAVAAAAADPRPAHVAWWSGFWSRSYVSVDKTAPPSSDGFTLSQRYALTRYVQAVQSRNTIVPEKFNGMAFIAAMENPDDRDWGPSNWWQNTRLPYGSMLIAGDFDLHRVILDYYTNMAKLLGPRTQQYWGHPGVWTTETQHLTGAYDMSDYGCGRPGSPSDPYPYQYMQSGYLHVDQGGDSGTGEWSLMAIDYFSWTNDARYLPLAFAAADYFMNRYVANLNASTGRYVVFPAQVLETYWCDYDQGQKAWTNCCSDDAPTISGMMTLFEKLLALPDAYTTAAQRAAWAAFVPKMPLLPVNAATKVIEPARIVQNGPHNGEGPELYAIHPHRVYTMGRHVASGTDISIGEATFNSSGWGHGGEGWFYGINAAALIGNTASAQAQIMGRAKTGLADGYRFPAFAPHCQDFDPSADHYANMNRAVQESLLQTGDDGFENPTIVLFAAWPCDLDVDFKLAAPLATTVEVSFAGGKLVSLVVTPASRASAVKWANCVSNN